MSDCSECFGYGYNWDGDEHEPVQVACEHCNGTGKIGEDSPQVQEPQVPIRELSPGLYELSEGQFLPIPEDEIPF